MYVCIRVCVYVYLCVYVYGWVGDDFFYRVNTILAFQFDANTLTLSCFFVFIADLEM